MLILALESSAKPVSVAVYEQPNSNGSGGILGQQFQNSGYSHSRTLLALAESLLRELGLKPVDIDLIAVANGPGSFTGVRIGVAAAKGLAFGLDIPVCGVSTLEAMAYQAASDKSVAGVFAAQTKAALIVPVMDARRGQVYNALFRRGIDGRPQRLCDDRAISIEELAADLESLDEPFMPVGDGIDLVMARFAENSALRPLLPPEGIKYQSAVGVALASLRNKQAPAIVQEPVYLRPSQAERVRLESTHRAQ